MNQGVAQHMGRHMCKTDHACRLELIPVALLRSSRRHGRRRGAGTASDPRQPGSLDQRAGPVRRRDMARGEQQVVHAAADGAMAAAWINNELVREGVARTASTSPVGC